MEVVVLDTPAEVASLAADTIEDVVRRRAAVGTPAVLGLATGSTPLATYEELIRRARDGRLVSLGRCVSSECVGGVGAWPRHPSTLRDSQPAEPRVHGAVPA